MDHLWFILEESRLNTEQESEPGRGGYKSVNAITSRTIYLENCSF